MRKQSILLTLILCLMTDSLVQAQDPTSSNQANTHRICHVHSTTAPDNSSSNQTFTPEVLMSLYRISNPVLSPDGQYVLYTRTLPNIEENKTATQLCLAESGKVGSERIIADAKEHPHAPVFIDPTHFAYLSTASGSTQIWVSDLSGNKHQLSDYEFDVQGFLFSPAMDQVLVIREVPLPNKTNDLYPNLPKTSGRIIDDLNYKHWDEWVTSIPQGFISTVSADRTIHTETRPILNANEWYETPAKPFDGIEEFAWSPDSKFLAYSCRKKVGLEYAISTNTDIYLLNTKTGETTNITEGMMGYDKQPSFSPDGKFIAWTSMEHDGYESDLNRLFIMDLKTGTRRHILPSYERNIDQFQWTSDSKGFIFKTNDNGLNNLFALDLKSEQISHITQYDMADVTGFDAANGRIAFGLQSMKHPTDIYTITYPSRRKSDQPLKVTTENDQILAGLPNIEVKKWWITTTDNKKMLTWVVLPPNFDPNKKYPAILYCQGGPQSTVSQFWSYRWNFRTFASHDFIMVAPNRRGVPGFGKEWNEQISGDYGGQNMKDYLAAIDSVAKMPYVDAQHLGCTGASYGGFSVFWLAGHHDKRFKAFCAHAGIFNMQAQYLETEEKFFANWDMGGAYWDKDNAVAQRTYANSPHLFVEKWDTPILVSCGEKDYRILASQGMMAFDAARMRGVPARMVLYPDENHWILKPQNGLLFYHTFFDWMDKWLKPKQQ